MVENNRRSHHHHQNSTTNNHSGYPDIDSQLLIGNVAEILPNQLYYACFNQEVEEQVVKERISYLSFHGKFHYEPFYQDFGPWNLSVLNRLCTFIDQHVTLEQRRGRKIVMYCCDKNNGEFDKIRVNCAYVLGSYLIIYQGYNAANAYLAVSGAEPPKYIGFRDASLGDPSYLLHLHEVLRGVEKALQQNWLDFADFDYLEYEFYEKVENGDFNWIIPGKILSFCGPHNESRIEDGYPYHAPEVYFDYFRERGVSTIVRLNAKNYEANKFVRAGFDHVDLFFVDGSTPSDEIVEKFIRVVDNAKGGVAVHCKAGLGRTGTLIACWMMKEYGLTACECMAWLRICRPGSVIGPQQRFLIDKQKMCWGLSKSNGVHLPRGSLKGSDKKSLKKLTNKVDGINLSPSSKSNDTKSENSRPRPNILPLRRKGVIQAVNVSNDETALDEKGRSQGDRLLALKAKQQHDHGKAAAEEFVLPRERRYTKHNEPVMNIPSQAYLNRNREPISSSRVKETTSASNSSRQIRSPNGNVAYRTRSSGVSSSNLPRTPNSAVFPSMAARRSDVTRFSSPTTPIKPMSPATNNSTFMGNSSMRYKTRLRTDNVISTTLPQPQISRCTVSAAEQKTPRILSASKSTTALRKIQLSRPRPYPPQGVRVELLANGSCYELRPRTSRDSPVLPGASLSPNTEALLGIRRKKTTLA